MPDDPRRLADRILDYLTHHVRRPSPEKLARLITREFRTNEDLRVGNAILSASVELHEKEIRHMDAIRLEQAVRMEKIKTENERMKNALYELLTRARHGETHSRFIRLIDATLRGEEICPRS